MDNAGQEESVTGTKPATPIPARSGGAPLNKLAANRMANKQRKKRAHRRTLRRSNTKG